MIARRTFLALAALGIAAVAMPRNTLAEEPIRIGDLNSYTSLPAFTVPYRQGWKLALDEINADGGVLGRKLEVISRDDGGNPGDAITVANELVRREGVSMLMGTLLSHVGLAVSDYAAQRETLFLASEPLTDALAWSKGNRYTFRLRPGTYVQAAMLAERAAKLDATRWAIVAPNYEYGQSAVEAFKKLLKARRPDVTFVAEQWPPLFKIDAGAVSQALDAAEPEAIFNVTFGTDLVKFVREGQLRGLFEGRDVVSVLTGEPEWMNPLGDEVPDGWIVTGYPWDTLDTPEHAAFREAYTARFDEHPRMGSVVGYTSLHALAKAMEAAGSTETDAVAAALRGMELATPFGEIRFRAADQQSTMGTFVGETTFRDGHGAIENWSYRDGAEYLPPEDEVESWRPEG
ncbi:ABC transporter substrate-binding protein [Ferruginivarius sediminum]|uniref:ABC transporter substrate-binding protein n=1 Tax=Ferruginivarius sediminum TaxID=2661937 RepID=A0A369TD15_9PROT|nr:ABC transporter substrate-binding protein [Ferruginivarius sediminum]RDD62712.1 ABC transporter substrate-binding protein [Ferruginivarius sediminum]